MNTEHDCKKWWGCFKPFLLTPWQRREHWTDPDHIAVQCRVKPRCSGYSRLSDSGAKLRPIALFRTNGLCSWYPWRNLPIIMCKVALDTRNSQVVEGKLLKEKKPWFWSVFYWRVCVLLIKAIHLIIIYISIGESSIIPVSILGT